MEYIIGTVLAAFTIALFVSPLVIILAIHAVNSVKDLK